MSSATKDKDSDFDFTPYDCNSAGWDGYLEEKMSYFAGVVDDRGSSLADCLLGIDEGGPNAGAPPLPAGAAAQAKAIAARRKRLKVLYQKEYKHITDPSVKTHLYNNHFNDGPACHVYIMAISQKPIGRLELRILDKKFDGVTIRDDIGVKEGTIKHLVRFLQAMNARRPLADRKTQDQLCERVLECIGEASRKFSEGVYAEMEAAVGSRKFEFVLPHPNQPDRDLLGIMNYYDKQWDFAITNGEMQKLTPQRKSSQEVRVGIDTALAASREHGFGASLLKCCVMQMARLQLKSSATRVAVSDTSEHTAPLLRSLDHLIMQ